MTLYIQPDADADLVQIWAGIGSENPNSADRLVDSAWDAFQLLARHPFLGPECRYPHRSLQGLRFWPVPDYHNFLIFYFVHEKKKVVEIFRILDGRRELPESLY